MITRALRKIVTKVRERAPGPTGNPLRDKLAEATR